MTTEIELRISRRGEAMKCDHCGTGFIAPAGYVRVSEGKEIQACSLDCARILDAELGRNYSSFGETHPEDEARLEEHEKGETFQVLDE